MLQGKGIISNLQKEILGCFRALPDSSNFHLSGGTALAEFYLGHRKSYDLDIFTGEEKLVLPFSKVFEDVLTKEDFVVTVVRRFSSFVDFTVVKGSESTKIQFAYDSPFRLAEPLDSPFGVKVSEFQDLITNKLLAFFGRSEPRDAVDLFFILKKKNIRELAELAVKKDPGFDLYWLAVALDKIKDYPDDIEMWPVEMLVAVDAKEIKDTFHRISLEILGKLEDEK